MANDTSSICHDFSIQVCLKYLLHKIQDYLKFAIKLVRIIKNFKSAETDHVWPRCRVCKAVSFLHAEIVSNKKT